MNDIEAKVLSINNEHAIEKIADTNIVLCYGHFNVIHPGHLRYLQYAKSLGGRLVVALQADSLLANEPGRNRYFTQDERAENVAALYVADNVVLLNDGELDVLIRLLPPKKLVLGREHERKEQSDAIRAAIDLVENNNGNVVYHAGGIHYASADLLHDNLIELDRRKSVQFKLSCKKQNISFDRISTVLNSYHKCNMLVIGDTIVDQYVACDPVGMSAEAPVLVVKEIESLDYVGGAAIVAMHVKSLGASCHYLSVVGDDLQAEFVGRQLEKNGVTTHLIKDSSRPTTYKTRYMVDNQKLFRVSKLKEYQISRNIEDQLIDKVEEVALNLDSIVISDFVYGVVTDRVLDKIRSIAGRYNINLFGDLQCSSQFGKVTKFHDFYFISPTEREARIALENQEDSIEWMANKLLSDLELKKLIITLGSEGFIAYDKVNRNYVNRQHFPALSSNPVDVTGAGDSLLAAISVSLSAKASLMEASAIGVGVSSLAVQNVGNIPIEKKQLFDYLREALR